MKTGPSTKSLSERLAERRAQQLDEMSELTQRLLSEHENELRDKLNEVGDVSARTLKDYLERMDQALADAEARQMQKIQQIDECLASAVENAARLAELVSTK